MEKKRTILAVLFLLMGTGMLTAQVASITAPQVVPGSIGDASIENAINQVLNSAAADIESQLNTEVAEYVGQDDLARGFANAGAAAAHIGTQRAYNDYKTFALTIGSGTAFSVPSSNPSEIEDAVNNIEQDKDIYFGAAAQPFTASLGINLGHFVDDLYGTIKFGYSNIGEGTLTEDFSFKSLTIGALLNYQLLETRRLPLGFLKWRGLSVGSGVLYQSNESVFKLDLPQYSETASADLSSVGGSGTVSSDLTIDTELTINASSRSVSIPLEATTGLRILWLIDLNIGAGVDLTFGSSDIDLSIDSPVTVTDDSDTNIQYSDGSVAVDAGTDGKGPQLIRPRITAGIGMNLGPVKLDMPVMYYFDTEGNSAMVGLNLGIVW